MEIQKVEDGWWLTHDEGSNNWNDFVGPDAERNARLYVAATKAFRAAATRLNCDALALARALEGGGIADMVEAMRLYLQVSMSADEARLCMVACNAPAMSRTDEEPGKGLHRRCDLISERVKGVEQALALLPPAQAEGTGG